MDRVGASIIGYNGSSNLRHGPKLEITVFGWAENCFRTLMELRGSWISFSTSWDKKAIGWEFIQQITCRG